MYKYVYIGMDDDFFRALYMGFETIKKGRLVLVPPLGEKHFIEKMLCSINLPFVRLRHKIHSFFFYKQYLRQIIDIHPDKYEKDCRFIIYSRIYETFEDSIIKYIKSLLPDSVLICYYGDLVSSHKINLEKAKKVFNLVASFDKKDARNNGISFIQEPYSYQPEIKDVNIKYDIFFVGLSKGRKEKIINAYRYFSSHGLRCKFFVVGVDESDIFEADGLVFNKRISYREVLSYIEESKCILEIVQPGGYSASSRYSEAIAMNKILITDCKQFEHDSELSQSIMYFDSIESVNPERIISIIPKEDKQAKDSLSIEAMIKSIEELL